MITAISSPQKRLTTWEFILIPRMTVQVIAAQVFTTLVVSAIGKGLTLASVVLLGAATLAVSVNACVQACLKRLNGSFSDNLEQEFKQPFCKETVQLSLMNLFNLSGLYYIIHEGGHALAALACFENASPKITFTAFRQGMTQFFVSNGLTPLGKRLGRQTALLVVAAAGIICSTLTAMIEFALSHGLEKHFPNLSRCLDLHAKVQLLHDLIYCLTTFITNKNNPYHDLMALWQDGGIHPLWPIALMISLPLLEKLAFSNRAKIYQ